MEFTRSPSHELIFDCSAVQFFRPLGLNLLASMISKTLQDGVRVRITLPHQRTVREYLHDQGFHQAFHLAGDHMQSVVRSTSVSLRRMDQLEYTYFEDVVSWLAGNSSLPRRSIEDTVKINLTELINNALDHSHSPIGCYISAQAYPHEAHLEFAILDLGIGFLGSLQPVFPDLTSHIEAIQRAVQEGVSSRARIERRTRGIGLTIIRDFLLSRGRLEIISHDGYWKQDKGGLITRGTLPFAFPGACVMLDIDQRAIETLYTDEELGTMLPLE
jgi:anti-sigma regulatory factor (Ser/Thr protein kinase)